MRKKTAQVNIETDGLDIDKLRAECPGVAKQTPEICSKCLSKLKAELIKAEARHDCSRQFELLRLICNCSMELKSFEDAVINLNKMLKLKEQGYDVKNLSIVYNSLGRIDMTHSDFQAAVSNFTKALELSEALGSHEHAIGACLNLSVCYTHLGQTDMCKNYLHKAMDACEATGNADLYHLAKSNLSNLYVNLGDLKEALELKQQCIEYYQAVGDKDNLARQLSAAAVIFHLSNECEKAIETAISALALKEELKDEMGSAILWMNLGVFYSDYGDKESGLRYNLRALKVFEKHGVKHSVARCLNNISNYYLGKKDKRNALRFLLKAYRFKQASNEIIGTVSICMNIARIYLEQDGHLTQAIRYCDLAINLAQTSEEAMELSRAKLVKATALSKLQKGEEAIALLREATTEIRDHAWEKLYPDIHSTEADVYQNLSQFREALLALKEYINIQEMRQRDQVRETIAEMKTKYEADRKEREAEIHRLKNIELMEKNRHIEEQNNKLQETLDKLHQSEIRYDFVSEELNRNIGSTLIGSSQTITSITKMITLVAKSDRTNVLITGETGTGKEIVARNIHFCSKRGKQHFYAVNCSAVPESLFESQFFGHEKDAFTGASSTKVGWFEIASGSTLFLDEIGTLSVEQQSKLLRALEERYIVRVGSHREIPIDLRVISATNLNLVDKVEMGEFRSDLYHRLGIFVINIPPLREHREDIPLLLKHFVGLASQAVNKRITKVDPDVLAFITEYDFPGNVRELRNMVERAVLVADCSTLRKEHFLISTGKQLQNPTGVVALDTLEREMILKALQYTGYNRVKAAKLLGVDRKVVERKILKHKLSIPDK